MSSASFKTKLTGLFAASPPSLNVSPYSPTVMELKKVLAAEVALAASQIVQFGATGVRSRGR